MKAIYLNCAASYIYILLFSSFFLFLRFHCCEMIQFTKSTIFGWLANEKRTLFAWNTHTHAHTRILAHAHSHFNFVRLSYYIDIKIHHGSLSPTAQQWQLLWWRDLRFAEWWHDNNVRIVFVVTFCHPPHS